MNHIDIRLKDSDQQRLCSFIGKTLESVDHDEFSFTNTSSQAVRFIVNGERMYLYSFTEPLDYFGSIEDVAVWSVEQTEYPMVSNKNFITMPVQQTVVGISLIQENQKLYQHNNQTYDVWVTRGIIFDFGDHQISFEKPVWFSEDIIIRKGYDLEKLFAPVEGITNAENWDDDIRMDCERTTVYLSESLLQAR